MSWHEMDAFTRGAWERLGWTEGQWDGDADPPRTVDMDWDELNTVHCKAAEDLGYTKATWEDDEYEH